MRTLIIAGILFMTAGSPLLAQTNADEIAQLKQRVVLLEKQVQELSQILEPIKARQAAENRQKMLRSQFEKKVAQDQAKYSPEQLREAEQLYQVANQKWGSAEAAQSLQAMISKYPDINRTGCAVLYVAQNSTGEKRVNYLKQCIEKYNDCFYGDGVQVGAYARALLADEYTSSGQQDKAAGLYNEIKTQYADAVDHSGRLLVDSIKGDSK